MGSTRTPVELCSLQTGSAANGGSRVALLQVYCPPELFSWPHFYAGHPNWVQVASHGRLLWLVPCTLTLGGCREEPVLEWASFECVGDVGLCAN